jgi:CO dehydrogenase maturation factor
VQLSAKISEMAAKINKPVFFVLNRMNEDALELRDLVDKQRIIGILPFDTGVFKACLKGDKVPEIKEMKEIVDRLMAE